VVSFDDPRGRLSRLLAVTVAGLAAGVATSYLQGVLPGSSNFLANSGAVWTVIAFVLALWVAVAVGTAVAAGVLALLGEVLGYYAIAAPVRHIATSSAERTLWLVAALVVGSIAGGLAHLVRRGSGAQRVASAAAICGVVAGEGWYALARLSHPVQGWVEIAVAGVALVASAVWLGRDWRARVAAAPAVAIAGLLVYAAYTTA
jgi:hypothetical protein